MYIPFVLLIHSRAWQWLSFKKEVLNAIIKVSQLFSFHSEYKFQV